MSTTRDYKDVLGGAVLALLGGAVLAQSLARYDLGQLRHMGPGMFPAILGGLLLVLGLAIALPALTRPGERIAGLDRRSLLAIVAAIGAFSATIDSFGLVPAVIVMSLIAVMADGRPDFSRLVFLPLGLVAIAVVVFKIALSMNFQLFKWPA